MLFFIILVVLTLSSQDAVAQTWYVYNPTAGRCVRGPDPNYFMEKIYMKAVEEAMSKNDASILQESRFDQKAIVNKPGPDDVRDIQHGEILGIKVSTKGREYKFWIRRQDCEQLSTK